MDAPMVSIRRWMALVSRCFRVRWGAVCFGLSAVLLVCVLMTPTHADPPPPPPPPEARDEVMDAANEFDAAHVDDNTNEAADAIVLDDLEPLEEDDDEDWDGRLREEDDDDEEAPVAVAPMAVFQMGNNAKVEVDEDDPFADILKKQPQFAAHVQQVRNNVEWMVGGDFTFAARACESTDEERAQMREFAQPALDKILTDVAKEVRAQFGLGGRFMNAGKKKSATKLRHDAVENVLTQVYWAKKDDGQEKPKQIEEWEQAWKARNEYNNSANSRVFVAALTERLFLDADQRKALTKSIGEVWKDEWLAYVSIMVHNPEYFPSIPSKALKPHLTDDQYSVWKSMPKTQLGSTTWQVNNSGFFNNGQQQKKNPWFNDPSGKAKKKNAGNVRVIRGRAVAIRGLAPAARVVLKAKDEEVVSLHELSDMLAMESGASIIKQAIEGGADVNEAGEDEMTPLHIAAQGGAEKIVALLLENDADPSSKNKDGKTPAEVAKDDAIAKLISEAAAGGIAKADKDIDDIPLIGDDLFDGDADGIFDQVLPEVRKK